MKYLLMLAVIAVAMMTRSEAQSNSAHEEDAKSKCLKMFDEIDDGAGIISHRCCIKWRRATCIVNTVPSAMRDSQLESEKIRLKNNGCDEYINNIGNAMPVACYLKYRLWVVITVAVIAGILVLGPAIACIVCVSRRSSRGGSNMRA